jgi:2-methoxy-6-polyprenyl-1,4-benzoquinol methylase
VFKNVAEKYDIMNDLMSAGIHRAWKDYFIKKINPFSGKKLLDVAGGTGDIAMRYLNYKKARKRKSMKEEKNEIIVCDVNEAMLYVGQRKAENLGISKGSFMLFKI